MGIKRNIKVLSLALVAVFAFSALAASAAQANAPRWTVGGTTITSGTSEAITASSTGTISLTSAGLTLKSTTNGNCTSSGKIVGSAAGAPGTGKEFSLNCSNVEVIVGGEASKVCTVHSSGTAVAGTVDTKPLKATLVWLKESGDEKVGALFEPAEGTTFVTLEVTGEACAIAGKYNVTGSAIGTVDPVTKDVTEGTITFPEAAHTSYWTNQTPTRTKDTSAGLKVGANPAVFEGLFDAKLTSDATFGVEPG